MKLLPCLILAAVVGTALGNEGSQQRESNRLIKEKSPYLLQHACNPVDWYPWGEEAFTAALKDNKPIFLSIGYSTCHWCHVMERECFEDAEVAVLMNKYFINIKVDREERPDIDAVYMKVAQYLGNGGGWPLSIVMTPDKKPFYAGTYIPKHNKFRLEGMMTLLPRLYRQYRYGSNVMTDAIARVEQRLERRRTPASSPAFEREVDPDEVVVGLLRQLDQRNGGFGRGMKFPRSHMLLYLMENYRRSGEDESLDAVRLTLSKIYAGGIYDQLGGGVHRYAVDPVWFVPHFEKMLYNQAQLSMAAVQFYELTDEAWARNLAEDTFGYVLRDLRSEQGGFYSAEDADSEGEEGAFYLWKYDHLNQLLDADELVLFSKAYGIKKGGNWTDNAHETAMPSNILFRTQSWDELSEVEKSELSRIRRRLFDIRTMRVRPRLDDKVLTDWNGLMIASLAQGGRILNNQKFLKAAEKAYQFIQEKVRDKGCLQHRYRDGEAAIDGMLLDYTALAWGALELYRSTHGLHYLRDAVVLMQTVRTKFRNDDGSFDMTTSEAEKLLFTPSELDDLALPAGNGIALWVFAELARYTGNPDFEREAESLLSFYERSLRHVPDRRSIAAMTLERQNRKAVEIVVVGTSDATATDEFLKQIKELAEDKAHYLLLKTETNAPLLAALAPFTEGQAAMDGKPTAYVCRGRSCLQPTIEIAEVKRLLKD